ncbi:hypothetical protein AX766_13255 [Flavobacterium covae]|nr:hypothetical protein AX766_13255 [Flavobacterium covae]
MNGIRSSRKLEKECIRNIEMQWLLEDIRPNYHSISDFRKDNPKALKQLFKLFVSFLKETCIQNNITTIVAQPDQGKSNKKGTQPEYLVSKFIYNKQENTYTCSQGKTLITTGRWHKKTRDGENTSYLFQKYRTSACKICPAKDQCTSRKAGREIDRSQYATSVEQNNQCYRENAQLYRKRQEINEHIFGTIKRQWGYNHTNLIGLEKVNGEHSLIMLVYNIKRTINILGVLDLIAKIKVWNSPYKRKDLFLIKTTYLNLFIGFIFFETPQNKFKNSIV